MDYGKYKYDQAKRQKKNKARSAEMKQIRLGRSVKIDEHDVKIRINQAYRFLMAGHKVQITQRFRGREIVHKDMGLERLSRVAVALASVAKVEVSPRWAGRQASIILAPDPNATRALEKAGLKPVPPPEIDQKILDELEALGDDGDFDDDDDDLDDDFDGDDAEDAAEDAADTPK
jgi:translation initiation factor IF-3